MLRGNWRKFAKTVGLTSAGFLTLVLTLGLGYYTGAGSGYYDGKAERAAAQYPSDTQRIVNECFELPSRTETAECVSEATKAAHENQRAEADLVAQRNMADWAWWVMVIGVLQFFATIATLGFVKLTLDATLNAVKETSIATEAMGTANDIARETAYHNIRPWLAITSIVFRSADFDDEGRCWLNASLTVKNFGKTPCTRAWIAAVITNFFDEEARDSAGTNRLSRGTAQMIDTIAPGEERAVDIMCVPKTDDLYDTAQGPRILDPILITHLNYFPFDEREKHVVGQIWNMGSEIHRESIQPLIEEDFLAGKTTPVVQIHRTVKIT